VTIFVAGAAVGATTYGTVQHLRGNAAAPVVVVAPPPAAEPPRPLPPAVVEPAGPAAAGAPSRPAAEAGRGREASPACGTRATCASGRTQAGRDGAQRARARARRERAGGAAHARALLSTRQLAEERESLMVQALVAKGETAQARQRAARFHRRYPQSLSARG